jgi:HNH endonuclease
MSSLRWCHTQRWRRRAALQLKLQPICAICLQNGQVVPATDADHIVPHKGNEWAFWYGELQSLCGLCHRSVKQKAAIAVTSASTGGRLIHGILLIDEGKVFPKPGPGGICKKFDPDETRPPLEVSFAKRPGICFEHVLLLKWNPPSLLRQ